MNKRKDDYILAIDQGQTCGYCLVHIDCSRIATGMPVIVSHGQVNINTRAGEKAMRAVMEDATARGRCHLVFERRWRGVSAALMASKDTAAEANRAAANIYAGQSGVIAKLSYMAREDGIRHRLPAVPPSTAKKVLTGHGRATKEQMQQRARAFFPEGEANEHEADALAIALAAAARMIATNHARMVEDSL
jgi:Holliday junction resolvasome RuvABC endonuclease subunit